MAEWLVVCVVLVCTGLVHSQDDWGYSGNDGPSHWKDKYPTCGEKEQSPINIVPQNAEFDPDIGAMKMTGYDVNPSDIHLTNTGKHAVLTFGDAVMTVQGGKLPATYTLDSVLFHWGMPKASNKGSEHTLDGKAFPGEIQLLHYDNKYKDVVEASAQKDGLAILGLMLAVGDKDNSVLAPVVHAMANVSYSGDATAVTPFAVKDLLSVNLTNFYRYHGSLTIPPCNQSVVWTLFQDVIHVSQNQMDHFYNLKTNGHNATNDTNMVDNFRPVQPLNGRTVYTTISTSGTSHLSSSDVMTALFVVVMSLLL